MPIKRISYNNKYKKNTDFEIVKISDFFKRVKLSLLKKDFRLNFYSLIYVSKGSSFHSVDFKDYKIEKDNIVILEKNKIHSFRDSRYLEGYIINISEDFFINFNNSYDYNLLSFFELPIESPVFKINTKDTSTNNILINLIYKEYNDNDYQENKMIIKSLFHSFIFSINKEITKKGKSYSQSSYITYNTFRRLVNENYKEIKDVKDYAKIMATSYKTINQACKKCTDISAKQIIINKLIIEAKRLILNNEFTNYEIAYHLGYQDPSNFSAFFKKHAKINMKNFRSKY